LERRLPREISTTRYYELWDTDSGNVLGSFGTEGQASALVRDLAGSPLRSRALSLVWGGEDDEERGDVIAAGGELLARARMAGSTSA